MPLFACMSDGSAEAREIVMPDIGPGTPSAITELGRVLGVKDPEGSMLRLAEVKQDFPLNIFRRFRLFDHLWMCVAATTECCSMLNGGNGFLLLEGCI